MEEKRERKKERKGRERDREWGSDKNKLIL